MNDLAANELETPIHARIKRVYYGPGVAFVPHPHINGAWVRVHPCVALSACPHCGVGVGVLCISTTGKNTSSHHYKRASAKVKQ